MGCSGVQWGGVGGVKCLSATVRQARAPEVVSGH